MTQIDTEKPFVRMTFSNFTEIYLKFVIILKNFTIP